MPSFIAAVQLLLSQSMNFSAHRCLFFYSLNVSIAPDICTDASTTYVRLDEKTNKCVYIAGFRGSWSEAFAFCQSIQGRLPNFDEVAFIEARITRTFSVIPTIMSKKEKKKVLNIFL